MVIVVCASTFVCVPNPARFFVLHPLKVLLGRLIVTPTSDTLAERSWSDLYITLDRKTRPVSMKSVWTTIVVDYPCHVKHLRGML